MGFGGKYYGVEAAYAAVYVGEVAFVFEVFYGAGSTQQYAGAVFGSLGVSLKNNL